MIIQCTSCGAKFRFDENLIEGEGAWMRCSQCMNVFFLDNPSHGEPVSHPNGGKGVKSTPSEKVIEKQELIFEDRTSVVKEPEILPSKDVEKGIGDLGLFDEMNVEKTGDDKTDDEDKVPEERVEKKQALTTGRQLFYLFFVLLIGSAYSVFFTETGVQPLLDKVLGIGQKSEEVVPHKLILQMSDSV